MYFLEFLKVTYWAHYVLFFIFNNNLPKDNTVLIKFFADDRVLYKAVESPSDQSKLNLILCKIQN